MTDFAVVVIIAVFVGGLGIGLGLILAPRIGRISRLGDDERDEPADR